MVGGNVLLGQAGSAQAGSLAAGQWQAACVCRGESAGKRIVFCMCVIQARLLLEFLLLLTALGVIRQWPCEWSNCLHELSTAMCSAAAFYVSMLRESTYKTCAHVSREQDQQAHPSVCLCVCVNAYRASSTVNNSQGQHCISAAACWRQRKSAGVRT